MSCIWFLGDTLTSDVGLHFNTCHWSDNLSINHVHSHMIPSLDIICYLLIYWNLGSKPQSVLIPADYMTTVCMRACMGWLSKVLSAQQKCCHNIFFCWINSHCQNSSSCLLLKFICLAVGFYRSLVINQRKCRHPIFKEPVFTQTLISHPTTIMIQVL